MINTSNEYKRMEERKYTDKATITLLDGTVLNVDETDIVKNGCSFDDAVSDTRSFSIGSAIINLNTLILNNIEGKFNDYDFCGAEVRPQIGLKLSETTEWLRKGVFTVDTPNTTKSMIILSSKDNMHKFEKPFSEVAIEFPTTALNLISKVCVYCGVYLATNSFTNSGHIINRRPDDEAISCREIVSWVAQISGNFARCNIDGALELKWYDMSAFEQTENVDGGTFDNATPYASGDSVDGGNFTEYSSGDNVEGGTFLQTKRYHHVYSLKDPQIITDDVVITGIQVKAIGTDYDYGETYLYGTEGYVIRIDDNPLIQEGSAQAIATSIGQKIVGMRFRPMSIQAVADPSIEAGDVAYVTDRKMNTYQTVITNLSYTIGKLEKISCDAESPTRRSATRYSASTKAIIEARQVAKKQLTAYDIAVQQFNDLISHSFGVYKTEETLEDGSTVHYMHDKPTLAESQNIWKQTASTFSVSNDGGQTYVAGFDAQGNAVFNVLHAIGINADWINAGEINGIKITTQSGKIGPFVMSAGGLTSNRMQLFDSDEYPLIWLTKEGEGGYGTEGYARANYEPSVTRLSSVEDGVETVITLIARTAADTGIAGTIEIVKSDVSTGHLISEQIIRDGEMIYRTYESDGVNFSEYRYSASGIQASGNGHLITVYFDLDNGTLDIQADRINLIGDVYINGQLQ